MSVVLKDRAESSEPRAIAATVAAASLTPVAVRELCAFTAKRGDLDLRFTPAPTAQQGIAGHGLVAARRGLGYQREVRLESEAHGLRIRGRADGLVAEPLVLEEIKTYRGELARVPGNHRALHWAQLKIYGAQLAEQRGLDELALRLVYFDIDHETETVEDETLSAEALRTFYDAQCETFADWDAEQCAHRQERDAALGTMRFPHAEFHAGQRRLANATYRALATGTSLLAQAPTGIGKSLGTLFPALKALGRGTVDKVFFLTAKTSGRKTALDAVASLATPDGTPLPLRVLELVARDKTCEHRDKACHGESCPLAKGFYDRLPAARAAAMQHHVWDQPRVRSTALAHGICPYYLAQELARWSDVVVGDYNYWFDQSALLHGLTVANEWRAAVLVDEAHNLVDRGRAMYSAELSQYALRALASTAKPAVATALATLKKAWRTLLADQPEDYQRHPEPPKPLVDALRRVADAIGAQLVELPLALPAELQRFYFDVLNVLGLAEAFGTHSIFDVQREPDGDTRLTIRNLVPAPFLAPRLAAARSVIAFSATLQPERYYRGLLGFGAATPWLDVPSPFDAGQLEVKLVRHISTRYAHRPGSAGPIARLIAAQIAERPGNYLAFFSSYEYLRQVEAETRALAPQQRIAAQLPSMSEADRHAFLQAFTHDSRTLGFAVLGGAFGEGVDLVGERLIGVFIATLGLPQLNPVNEEMKKRMAELFGEAQGYDYSYLYPGLRKVVQAAGRVIRSATDRGSVILIDDRYGRAEIRTLLPAWWRIDSLIDGSSR